MDTVGILLNVCVTVFAIYPYFLTIFCLLLGLDPLMTLYKYWFPKFLTNHSGFNLCFYCARFLQLIPLLLGVIYSLCLFVCPR